MNNDEELYYPLDQGGFAKSNVYNIFQKLIGKYNRCFEEEERNENKIRSAIEDIIIYAKGGTRPKEFVQAMVILLLAFEKKSNSRAVWLDSANIAFHCGDLEICRELVLFAIEKSKRAVNVEQQEKEKTVDGIMNIC